MSTQKPAIQLIDPSNPLQSIPPEILSKIFLVAISADTPFKSAGPTRPWHKAVLLSLVCKHWRAIVLYTPAFWTEVHGPRLENTKDVFLRSGSLPISLWIYEPSHLPLVVIPAASRLRDLTVLLKKLPASISQDEEQRIYLELFGLDMPALRSLILKWLRPCGWGSASYFAAITEVLLQHPKPLLQQLSLTGCSLPSMTNVTFSQLRVFDYYGCSEISLLLQALAAMPALEKCTVTTSDGGATWEEFSAGMENIVPVTLVNLTSLALDINSFMYSAALLSCLKTPSLLTGSYEIQYEAVQPDPAEYLDRIDEILEGVGLSSNSESPYSYAIADLIDSSGKGFKLHLYPDKTGVSSSTTVSILNLSESFDTTGQALIDSLQIPGLESFTISEQSWQDRGFLSPLVDMHSFLRRHIHIRHLQLRDCGIYKVSAILSNLQSLQRFVGSPKPHCILPELRHITIHSIVPSNNESELEVTPNSNNLQSVEWLGELVKLVDWRSQQLYPVQEITISSCPKVSHMAIKGLEAAIPSVKVNWVVKKKHTQ